MRNLELWLYREVHGRPATRRRPRRGSVLSRKPWRSWKYRRWISSLPSAVSGLLGCDPCHTGAHAYGRKASDATCIPLTRREHDLFDADPEGFARQHSLDVKALVKRLNHAWFNQWKIDQGNEDEQ